VRDQLELDFYVVADGISPSFELPDALRKALTGQTILAARRQRRYLVMSPVELWEARVLLSLDDLVNPTLM